MLAAALGRQNAQWMIKARVKVLSVPEAVFGRGLTAVWQLPGLQAIASLHKTHTLARCMECG